MDMVDDEPSKVVNVILDKCYKCNSEIELRQVEIKHVESGDFIAIEALCRKCVEKLEKRYK